MKFFTAEIIAAVRSRRGRRDLRVLGRFFVVLLLMIVVYSILFHVLMLREGQQHTWITGAYWTLTVMSTLGFGDITFHTDLGRGFSILVLMSGMIFLLVLLPFTFIEFFYQPWIQAQATARAPRQLPETTRDHVLLTNYDPVTATLIRRLEPFHYSYVMLVPDLDEALRLHDLGINVMVGQLDDPEAWKRARVSQAALVATTSTDARNTTVASTVRAAAAGVPIIGTANREASIDILEMAGCDQVLRLEVMLGQTFARRANGGDALAHVIGKFDDVLIAEAMTRRTPLVGKTLRECKITRHVGVTVVGVWKRGLFEVAGPDLLLDDDTVMLLAGSQQAIDGYNEFAIIYNVSLAPVVILGGGRVGRATATYLEQRGIDYRVVELVPGRVPDRRAVHRRRRRRPPGAQEGGHRRGAGGDRHHPRRRHQRLPHRLLPPAALGHPDHQPRHRGAHRPDPAPGRRRHRHVVRLDRRQQPDEPAPALQDPDDHRGSRHLQGRGAALDGG